MIKFFILILFSSCSANLVFQYGLGLKGLSRRPGGDGKSFPWYRVLFLFISVLSLWIFYTLFLSLFSLGIFAYIILFPLSAILPRAVEKVLGRPFHLSGEKGQAYRPLDAYEGFCPAASLLTLHLASSFAEALALALGFSLGILFSLVLIREVGRRSSMEQVNRFLRGNALTLVSLGLASLILSAASVILIGALSGSTLPAFFSP
jgi:Na+-translocating ferredoxin:NAD+ oxidoreductase RnfA subunit